MTMVMTKEKHLKEMKMGGFYEVLLEEIFSHVELKPLTRMKCVSKDWCCLISHITKSRLGLKPFGLISLDRGVGGIMEEEEEEGKELVTNIRLFDVNVQGGHLEYLENKALRFTLDDLFKSLCFTNGLLLCAGVFSYEGDPILYDLSLKQLIPLPSVTEFIDDHMICMGLASDGLQNRCFKLVCLCFDGNIDFSYYVIFSSETGEWKKHRARVSNFSSQDNHNTSDDECFEDPFFGPPIFEYECLFHKGLIYWTLNGYFIVYNLEDDFFEIHDLPVREYADGECLWVSEGCLHYARNETYGFSVWTRVKGVERDSEDEHNQNEDNKQIHQHYAGWWKLKHTVQDLPYKIGFLKPCAFEQDFQILFLENLELPSSLLSYNIETGCLKEVKKM